MKHTKNISWFSIIEVLVGIFIFTLGLISIYLIMVSSLKLNDYNKNQIIASNLAREQIELMRNVRDSNYNALYAWNSLPDRSWTFVAWNYYKVENNFWWWDPVLVNDFVYAGEWEENLWVMESFRLCLDAQNRYVYCNGSSTWLTPFYKYVTIEWTSVPNTFKLISKVMWYKRWYHDLEINTILADWKRL